MEPFIRQIPYFQAAKPELVQYLADASLFKNFEKHSVVFTAGEPAQGLYYLVRGLVKAVRYAPNGRELIIRFFASGQTFNEVGAIRPATNSATAIAVKKSDILLLPREALQKAFQRQPDIQQRLIEAMTRKLQFAMTRIEELTFHDVRTRLIRFLLEEAVEETAGRSIAISQEDLAARLGTVRQVLGRVLAELQRIGTIQVRRGRILVRDRELLEDLLGHLARGEDEDV